MLLDTDPPGLYLSILARDGPKTFPVHLCIPWGRCMSWHLFYSVPEPHANVDAVRRPLQVSCSTLTRATLQEHYVSVKWNLNHLCFDLPTVAASVRPFLFALVQEP